MKKEKNVPRAKLELSLIPSDLLDFISEMVLKAGRVSEGIGDKFKSWKCWIPVLITAQTGFGKNYFVEFVLILYALSFGFKVLILSNRTMTERQQKVRIAKLTGCEEEIEDLPPKFLDKRCEFGSVTVKTYQRLIHELLDDKYDFQKKYDYVVLDECHFFTSDATYNPHTEFLLNKIPNMYRDSVRIYMTATPEEVLKHIAKVESQDSPKEKMRATLNPLYTSIYPRCLQRYTFKYSYKHINPYYFNNTDEVILKIKSDTTNEKWLIFVDKKEEGEKLNASIENSIFIDASAKKSTKKDGEIFNEIIEKESFDCKVLITTCVLDNGVNLSDKLITNIVILSYDRIQWMQMLGRRRMNPGETINVYMAARSVVDFNIKIHQLNQKIEAISLYKKNSKRFMDIYALGDANKHAIAHNLFYNDEQNQPVLNRIAETKIYTDHKFFTNMKNAMEKDFKAFILEQLSWMGLKKSYNPTHWLSYKDDNSNIQSFRTHIEESIGKTMTEDDFMGFSDKFKELYIMAYGAGPTDRPDRRFGLNKIRKKFAELGLDYVINCKNSVYNVSYGKHK